ncbi:YbhB/YbcL family Raf kinase inhibitor-like protein [Halorientalis sp.]|jgi:Raf kinase inhibitor-like YbhB/YbcL family protein|uniref:YbhB/YbcL family Raf kinase inhibitor-like protein n=1 Tax=Halorientalis sp. TaxID=1931229 RepID=UPI002626E4BB|nr:YbhB/YbcL family Raf kinase inhibitor-like protein [Halorientalis sp.]
MSDLRLESPAFDDGERIPDRYGYTEDDVNPPLRIESVPDGAESLVLIVDDPDAMEPAGKIWDHWLVWNIAPGTSEIPENWAAEDAMEGQNDYGEHGYGGPNPPDREHTYRFRLYALDTTLPLSSAADKNELEDEMMGQLLANTRLEGTYAP